MDAHAVGARIFFEPWKCPGGREDLPPLGPTTSRGGGFTPPPLPPFFPFSRTQFRVTDLHPPDFSSALCADNGKNLLELPEFFLLAIRMCSEPKSLRFEFILSQEKLSHTLYFCVVRGICPMFRCMRGQTPPPSSSSSSLKGIPGRARLIRAYYDIYGGLGFLLGRRGGETVVAGGVGGGCGQTGMIAICVPNRRPDSNKSDKIESTRRHDLQEAEAEGRQRRCFWRPGQPPSRGGTLLRPRSSLSSESLAGFPGMSSLLSRSPPRCSLISLTSLR